MQTVISSLAFTFVDDAIALTTGLGRMMRDLTLDGLAAARARITAPIDRLARACDVAHVIPAREAAMTRFNRRSPGRKWPAARRRRNRLFAALDIFASFRAMRDLT